MMNRKNCLEEFKRSPFTHLDWAWSIWKRAYHAGYTRHQEIQKYKRGRVKRLLHYLNPKKS